MRSAFSALLPALVLSVGIIGSVDRASAALLTFDNVLFPGTGVPLSATGSDGTGFAFAYSVPGASQFQAFKSGGGFGFSAGTFFLAPGLGRSAPLTVSYSTPLSSISIPLASGNGNNYVSTVSFYDGSDLLKTFNMPGNTSSPATVFSFNQLSTSAVLGISSSDAIDGFTSNIGPISYSVAPVPLPPALPMFGAALLGIAAMALIQKRKGEGAASPA